MIVDVLKVKILFLSIVGCFTLSSMAIAEVAMSSNDLQKSPRVQGYINSQGLLQSLFKVGEIQDKRFKLQQDCKSKRKVQPLSIIITSPVDFPSDLQHPKTGSWIYEFQYERCGEKKIYNAKFSVKVAGSPVSISTYFPGRTLASNTLILDATQTILPLVEAESGVKGCKSRLIQDMTVIEKPHAFEDGDQIFNKLWKESWLFNICGTLVKSKVVFYQKEGMAGTSFFAESTKPYKP